MSVAEPGLGWSILPAWLSVRAMFAAVEVAERLRRTETDDLEAAVGCALLYGQLDLLVPGQEWAAATRESVTSAARAAERSGAGSVAMFGGLTGLATAAHCLSPNGSGSRKLRSALDAAILPAAIARAETSAFAEYEAVSGLSGTGAYLLTRGHRSALRRVLTGLVALCSDDAALPEQDGAAYGPLALLALALRSGVSVPGQREAVARVAGRLAADHPEDEWVARAIWHAGMALHDDALRARALGAMVAVYRRPYGDDESPGLYRGVAGLLQITLRFAWDTGEALFVDAATVLTQRLLDRYRPEHAWGYQFGGDDRAGLLDGAAGVALTLLAASTERPIGWDRMFLLS